MGYEYSADGHAAAPDRFVSISLSEIFRISQHVYNKSFRHATLLLMQYLHIIDMPISLCLFLDFKYCGE